MIVEALAQDLASSATEDLSSCSSDHRTLDACMQREACLHHCAPVLIPNTYDFEFSTLLMPAMHCSVAACSNLQVNECRLQQETQTFTMIT